MSNIKAVVIAGELPFNTYENEGLNKMLGSMNAPSFGLRITWTGKQRFVDNNHGGQTSMHEFCIEGAEAVREEWIHRLVGYIRQEGSIRQGEAVDIENGAEVWSLAKEEREGTKIAGIVDLTPEPGALFNRFITEIVPETDAVLRAAHAVYPQVEDLNRGIIKVDVFEARRLLSGLLQRLNSLAAAISITAGSTTNATELKKLRDVLHESLMKVSDAFQKMEI